MRSIAILISSLGFVLSLAGCVAEKATYTCQTWCKPDASDVTNVFFAATDETDAADQCFESLGGTCPGGGLRKCTCQLQDQP